MITKPRFLKTKDGRIALVSVTYDHGSIKTIDGPYQILGDRDLPPELLIQRLNELLHEALHATEPIEGYENE